MGKVQAIDVLGDGNCLARALCVAQGKPQREYQQIKVILKEELVENRTFYKLYSFTDSDIDTYIKNVSADNNWLSTDMFFVYANALNIGVALHKQTQSNGAVTAGISNLYLPFRNKFFMKSIKIIHVSWHSPANATHFIALNNVNAVPSTIFMLKTARNLNHLPLFFDCEWRRVNKYTTPTKRTECSTIIDDKVSEETSNVGMAALSNKFDDEELNI